MSYVLVRLRIVIAHGHPDRFLFLFLACLVALCTIVTCFCNCVLLLRRFLSKGIFLSPLEEQSSRMFEFVFKMFSVGAASLPEGGMGQVPLQIAADLPEGQCCQPRVFIRSRLVVLGIRRVFFVSWTYVV